MKWMGKLTGGLLGALLGPLGVFLGVLLGHQFDEAADEEQTQPATPQDLEAIGERFFRATFRVMGCIAKADGRVSQQEIAAARAVMTELRLSAPQVQAAIECFGAGKQPGFDLEGELRALSEACHGRRDVLRVFFEIQVRAALGGNNLDGRVRPLMRRVASLLSISTLEATHIETVLRIHRGAFGASQAYARGVSRDEQLQQAYRTLETRAAASDEEVTKAYRRQLQRHHPDKLKANGLPESMLGHAQARTQQIIEAWELIRARRGIS
jgi:DnaJ like chaperone protein